MKYPTKKNSRGVSIIEIVVSMVLIFLVMLVLAFVYPQGRRVTQGSDNRTKATEIAKSIMEEIQLIPLLPQSWAGNDVNSLKNVSLVKTNTQNSVPTLDTFAGNYNAMKKNCWPYHHLSGSGNWDATEDSNNQKTTICPFFIYSSGDLDSKVFANQARPFFISTSQLVDRGTTKITIPKGVVVSPDSSKTPAVNRKTPIIATITVSVAWGETSTKGITKGLKYNYVSIINTRTENVY